MEAKGQRGATECNEPLPGILRTGCRRFKLLAEPPKPLIDYCEKQVVLIAKVEIDGCRRVTNALSHLAQREALITVLQEQFACCRQYGVTQFLLLLVLPVANRLAQTFSLSFLCAFFHNNAPLDNIVILTCDFRFVKRGDIRRFFLSKAVILQTNGC